MGASKKEKNDPIIESFNDVQNPFPSIINDVQGIEASFLKSKMSSEHPIAARLSMNIQWMIKQGLSHVEIMLDPPELGPLMIQLNKKGEEMSILFQVNHAHSKAMLEDNVFKLKAFLLEKGVQLIDVNVEYHEGSPQKEESSQKETLNRVTEMNAHKNKIFDNDSFLEKDTIILKRKNVLLDTYI
jgi:flagellar hook-length control protein FliK